MKEILNLLSKEAVVSAFLKGGKTIVCSDNEAEALVYASAFSSNPRQIIIIKHNLYSAQNLFERLSNLLPSDSCYFFPSDESFRIEALASSKELITQRLFVLSKLMEQKDMIVVAHTASIVRHLPSVKLFSSSTRNIKVGETINVEEFIEYLVSIGYERCNMIEHSLQFARRGGVLDIYSVNYENPIRIEFFGDEIDDIRFFDLESKHTIKSIKEATIIPATDLLVSGNYNEILKSLCDNAINDKQKTDFASMQLESNYSLLYKYYSYFESDQASFLDYVSKDALLVVSNKDYIFDNYKMLSDETLEYLKEEENEALSLLVDLTYNLKRENDITYINEFKHKDSDIDAPILSVDGAYGRSDILKGIIQRYLTSNKVVLCVENKNQLDCLKNWVEGWNMKMEYLHFDKLPHSKLSYCELALKEGFMLPTHNLVYLSAKELFGTRSFSNRNVNRYRQSEALKTYENLHLGDYVIHEKHGIGKFLGIESMEFDGIHRDYLHIAYRNNSVLYVPLEQFRLIRKYVSREGVEPKLNKLGGEEWKKTKSKIKERISDIADRLVALYSSRVQSEGFAFEVDNEWQKEFEISFPYELTDDQKTAVKEIKHDMESNYPMDRLLCGDVGFGKTEVAFIAAFKAIISGKQVAMLCPTTILAQQHYDNAINRFKNFDINIGMLNRFVPEKKQKEYLEDLASGKLHFIIGTHRLLSKDVKFKDLGLLIVDEEQRFGVEHKEIIKELKKNVDVLTLTATPIPRTLQMSLVGIRSLSQINTPPNFRMPIQTYVVEKNMSLVREIIERELSRHGQVFYLYNKISTINSVANDIKRHVKDAKVMVIHGKMDKEDIEESMYRFQNGDANVLVCTTIIENGIDIPNANTMIVEDADHFGLSQLYQIKGRVGRSDRLAYAYFLYHPQKQMSDIATKRLRAIKEFAELGSGYKIAMRDLSIRGAGDILGAEQSGFIDMVGIDTYIRLLNEAIEERKTGIPTKEVEIHTPLHIDAYINKDFTDDLDKINLYQKIDEVKSIKELKELEKVLSDVYGKLPNNVKLLLEKRRLELFESVDIVASTKDNKQEYEITFSEEFAKIESIGIDLFKIIGMISNDITLSFRDSKIKMKISKKDKKWLDHTIKVLDELKVIVKKRKMIGEQNG